MNITFSRLTSLLFLLFWSGWSTTLNAQSDTTRRWERILARFLREDQPVDRPRLLLYPTLAYTPETSLEIGVATALLFHAKNDAVNNRLSELTAFGFVTLRAQYGLWVDNAVYTDRDKWLILGRVRLHRFPLLYYGIGAGTAPDNPDVVDGYGVIVRERMFRRMRKNVFGGIQLDYQSLSRVEFGEGGISARPLPLGARGSANLGLGLGVAYDSRPNALNTRDGWFAELGWLHYAQTWGSQYAFDNYNADVRFYKSFRTRQVFAAQFVGNVVSGSAPFNQLSLLGNESMMRGYYTGRFRDQQYYALQAEYRWLPFSFSKRIGGAVFLGAGTVAPQFSGVSADKIRLAGGAGLRYLLFAKKDIFLRMDLGFTREGTGFYIYTGEAF